MMRNSAVSGTDSSSMDEKPPRTLRDELDELAANGFDDEVAVTRARMRGHTESFLRVLLNTKQ